MPSRSWVPTSSSALTKTLVLNLGMPVRWSNSQRNGYSSKEKIPATRACLGGRTLANVLSNLGGDEFHCLVMLQFQLPESGRHCQRESAFERPEWGWWCSTVAKIEVRWAIVSVSQLSNGG